MIELNNREINDLKTRQLIDLTQLREDLNTALHAFSTRPSDETTPELFVEIDACKAAIVIVDDIIKEKNVKNAELVAEKREKEVLSAVKRFLKV